jgi:nucleoside-diphosphate-sugar epimerase
VKVLIIGGNGFVGRRLSLGLDARSDIELHVLNRHGAVRGAGRASLHKGNRNDLPGSGLDRDWDAVVDFVAFDDRQANAAVEYFRGAKRYIFISSQSVYDAGGPQREGDFDPSSVDLTMPAQARDPGSAYQEGKRRAEAAFAKAPFPTVLVRFPFLLGPDDYSRRLEFHIDRVKSGQPIAIPELGARISLIHAADACSFLEFALGAEFSGPINVASPDPITLGGLIAMIEAEVGKPVVIGDGSDPESQSPYGPPGDYFMATGHSHKLGFTARPVPDWLPALIREKAAGSG